MILTMLINQTMGLINLAVPIVIAYQVFPQFTFTRYGMLLYALIIGVYLFFINYRAAQNQMSRLAFVPTGDALASFNDQIKACALNPADIRLRYAYTGDGVAMATMDTVQIDPLLWQGIEQDPACIEVTRVIEQFILPTIPADKKALNATIKEIMTKDAQRFIFKHELGHLYHNYSMKKLVLVGCIGFISAIVALATAAILVPFNGYVALVGALLVGGLTDLKLSYASNVLFKAREERKADLFAARFSTPQEIEAAAAFFENYERCAHEYKKNTGLLKYVPGVVLSGHPDGYSRATYLRKCIVR